MRVVSRPSCEVEVGISGEKIKGIAKKTRWSSIRFERDLDDLDLGDVGFSHFCISSGAARFCDCSGLAVLSKIG